jgi:hypothetical protein
MKWGDSHHVSLVAIMDAVETGLDAASRELALQLHPTLDSRTFLDADFTRRKGTAQKSAEKLAV